MDIGQAKRPRAVCVQCIGGSTCWQYNTLQLCVGLPVMDGSSLDIRIQTLQIGLAWKDHTERSQAERCAYPRSSQRNILASWIWLNGCVLQRSPTLRCGLRPSSKKKEDVLVLLSSNVN
eukprot:scpid82130/ scgid13861/ 